MLILSVQFSGSLVYLELGSHQHNLILQHIHHCPSSVKPLIPRNSHLGEIFLTGHACHVLPGTWHSLTLGRNVRDLVQCPQTKKLRIRVAKGTQLIWDRARSFDFLWSYFSLYKMLCYSLPSNWPKMNSTEKTFPYSPVDTWPLSLASHLTWVGKKRRKDRKVKRLPLYSVMLPHALTLLGKSYKEFYWA